MDYNEMLVSIGDVRRLLYKILPENVTITAIENYVGSLSPIVDVKPVVHGTWVWKPDMRCWECDQCGETTTDACMYKPRAKFCPWCGADMRKNDGQISE